VIRLGFNARPLQFPDTRGWNRYAVELLAELPACGVEPILYTDRAIHDHHLARLGPLGEGGETFSLDTPAELANLIRRVALEPAFCERLVHKARARATGFSWRKTAELTAEVYRELITVG
jgi:glycosyltransferase involved in cell wall biosynthesis